MSGRRAAGVLGVIAVLVFLSQLPMIGFLDEDPSTHQRGILGYRVLGGYDRLTEMIVGHEVDTVIVSSRLIDAVRFASVQQLCLAHGIKLFRCHIELQTLADSLPQAGSGDGEESPPQILQA